MTPVAVADGDAAVAAARSAAVSGTPFGLALLDHVLPREDGRGIARRLREDGSMGDAPFVLLSSMGASPAVDDEAIGIRARLSKPVIASRLLEVIQRVLAGSTRPDARGEGALEIVRGIAARPLHILLAEDNAINSRVAVALLEKVGHSVLAVENGRLAIDALAREHFDLVLMDAQMPEMDGFEATRRIRARETADGPRIPIISLTAQAMIGDRERCLAAGADDYVAKPIRPDLLYRALERHGPTAESSHRSEPTANQPPRAVDLDAMLDSLGGDAGLQSEVVRMFLDSAHTLVSGLCEQVAAADATGVERAAHKLKGSLAHLCAEMATGAAATLEAMGRTGNLADVGAALGDLEREVSRVEAELIAWTASRPQSAPLTRVTKAPSASSTPPGMV
jgi:CheY-like chemotaxis protein/HPt (histidine-containing phosphotransfer) domain-containing protein